MPSDLDNIVPVGNTLGQSGILEEFIVPNLGVTIQNYHLGKCSINILVWFPRTVTKISTEKSPMGPFADML